MGKRRDLSRNTRAVASNTASWAELAGQRLLHVDAPVAVLDQAADFYVAQPCVDGLVFCHYLVGDQGHAAEPAAGGFLLGESHEGTAEPAAQSAGIHGDVLDIQVVF